MKALGALYSFFSSSVYSFISENDTFDGILDNMDYFYVKIFFYLIVKLELRDHLWDKEKVVFQDR
jgi:hypothetical protein